MKILFTCDEFTLDLTGKELNWTEENSWFSDDFILSSTFPFDIEYHENDYFLQFKNYNDFNLKTKFDGILQRADGKLTPAYLEIQEGSQTLKGVIRDGIELFPSWNESINTFDLGIVDVPDMVNHAETVVTKTWPQVNYNFPMIECHELYKDSPHFAEHFRGFYNFRTPGSGFLRNIESTEFNVAANNNIVYPMPYYLHILRTGITKEGYTLHGDVLEDEDFKKAIMPIRKIEYFNERPETIEVTMGYADLDEDINDDLVSYYHTQFTLAPNTRYRITGELLAKNMNFRLLLNETVIYSIYRKKRGHKFEMIIEPGEEITLTYIGIFLPLMWPGYNDIFEGLIVPMEVYDNDGDLITHVANFNKVDLAAQLPNITFGDFVKIFKTMKNYDFDLRPGKQIWMNRIEDDLTHDEAIDLRNFEILYPVRTFEEKGSFLLKYETPNDDYPSIETFVSLDETITGVELEAEEDTKEVLINCNVLPVVKNGLFGGENGPHITAKIIDDSDDKASLVLFDSLKNNWNYTLPVDQLQTPVLVEKYWKKFIYFYIRYIKHNFTIVGKTSQFHHLNKKSKIFIFNNFHIIESLNRKVKDLIEEIEVICRSY